MLSEGCSLPLNEAGHDHDVVIRVSELSKVYQLYNNSIDRIRQALCQKMFRFIGKDNISFSREHWALKNVSFAISKGESVGVIGRNGAGKSTLLQIICGTLHPSHGEVEVRGRVAALLELGSGFNPEYTGRENVYLNAAILGLNSKEIDDRFQSIIEFADIGEFIDAPVKTYSSGMLVRLAFSVIAHVDADILIIDEALAVGDAFFTQKCMRFLRSFMESGTVFFVSHDTGAILNLCSSAMCLENGSIIKSGNPKDVVDWYLESQYEAQQGESVSQVNSVPVHCNKMKSSDHPDRDMRLDFINTTNLRNDIELFPFSDEATAFGKSEARIITAQIYDENDRPLTWVVGGECIRLVIRCVANNQLTNPIIGFQIKDRLGQVVIVDNTYITYANSHKVIKKGSHFSGMFEFRMPVFPVGDYTISPAVATGTQDHHVQQHWIHDAISFTSHAAHCGGLVGLEMISVELSEDEL